MIKKTISYTSYDGEPVTEDFYFNLTKAELVELEVSEKEGFNDTLKNLVAEQEGQAVVEMFKRIIILSVGQKSPDGRRFIKNDAIRDDFMQSPAYSELFVELATVPEAAAAFVKGVIPPDLVPQDEDVVELPAATS